MSVPQLPPTPRSDGRNVVDILAGEHRAMLAMCRALTAADPTAARRRRLANVVVATVARHVSAEQRYLYPAVRAAAPGSGQLVDRELIADAALLTTCKRLCADGTDLAGTLHRQLVRHAEAAAEDVLPLLLRAAPVDELVRLGARVASAEGVAPTRAHPGAPSTPPWNRLLAPTLGVVDRMLDVVSRRVTWADRM
jgi:hypothetical protein